MRIVVIGLGGVGSILAERICRFLNFSRELDDITVFLVDGDEYEPKNQERQEFRRFGNKAEIKITELELNYTSIIFEYYTHYINPDNIQDVIKDEDVVFLCVDNHKTRNLVSSYCRTLTDVTLISGGNELTDGNVQLYIRKGGEDLTPDLCAYHPEIADPDDKLPDEMSCEELSQSEPQLYFTNLGVATIMCWVFYNTVVEENYERSEVYFDIRTMTADSKVRNVK